MPCLVERYTHQLDGQTSHLTLFRSDSKRGGSINLSHQQHQRVVRQREFVCRKCKKSFHLDEHQQQAEPFKRIHTPRLREKSPLFSPLDVLQQNATPPSDILSKPEFRLKTETPMSEITPSTDHILTRKRDRKMHQKNHIISKKRRVTDGDSKPSSITPPDTILQDSLFPITNKTSPSVNIINTPLELSATQLPKDRIKAQYSSLNSSRLSPGRRPSSKSIRADKPLKLKPCEESDTSLIKCQEPLPPTAPPTTNLEQSKSDESSLPRVRRLSATSSTSSNTTKREGKLEMTPDVEKTTIMSTFSLSNPTNTSPKLGNTTSTPFRRRSGCYEKPKNRWIRAERNRDTEEKRRKSVDTAHTSICNGPVPSSPAYFTDSELPNCVMADMMAETVSEKIHLPPLGDSIDIPAVLPPIKIKINRNVATGSTESSDSTEYQVISKEVPSPTSPAPTQPSTIPTESETVEHPPSVPLSAIIIEAPHATIPCQEKKTTTPLSSNANPNRSFVKRCQIADSASTVFRLGDVVWCKLAGWPSWPARITSLSRDKSAPKDAVCTACVRWFAWDQVSYMACDKLWPFLTHYERKLDKRKKRGAYKQAVEEALVAAQAQKELLIEDDGDSEDDGSGWVDETSSNPPPASFRCEPTNSLRGCRRGGPGRKPKQQPHPVVNNGCPLVSSATQNGMTDKVVEPAFSEDESECEGQLIIDPGVPPAARMNTYVLQLSNSLGPPPNTPSVTTAVGCIDRFPIPTVAHGNDTTTWT